MPTVNDMIVFQASAILNSIQHQATGQAALTASTPGEFISVAQSALRTGYDPIVNAMSQVWGRTVFSVRDYAAPFARLEWDADRWGNAWRKISFVDHDVMDDERFTYPVAYDANQTPPTGNGLSVDMFKIHKPEVQQLAFYGQSVYEDCETIFRDNLDVAFTGPEEFVRFNSAEVQVRSNKLEQYRETTRRSILANACASLISENNSDRVIHLVTEYNSQTGSSLTSTTVYDPANFPDFVRWLYGFIGTLARMFSRRSNLFQTVVNSKVVNRHTPPDRLNIYMYAPLLDQINSRVRSVTYHDDILNDANWEGVDFWQAIKSAKSINLTPTYTNTSGQAYTPGSAVTSSVVVGLLFDDEAMGYSMVNTWTSVTPFVSNGGYWNDWYHANIRTKFDMTEKMAVLLMD